MKIHFDNVNLSSTSGPCSFAARLYVELLNRGHDLVDSGNDADISLVFIEPSGRPVAKRVVQRLDGIWFKPEEFVHKNALIRAQYQVADAVIWQSEFDRNMITSKWGLPKNGTIGTIIHNGIGSIESIQSTVLSDVRNQYEHVFVCSSNWHPQKRLRANIELFSHLHDNGYANSCMIVMGANPDVWVPSPHIMYTGPVPHDVCLSVFEISDWMIHLAWLDHCPNVVVEALSKNVPVICSNSGGTKELVRDYGIILNEKREYEYELIDYDNPPMIDVSQIKTLPQRQLLGKHADVSIGHIASKYIELFEKLL